MGKRMKRISENLGLEGGSEVRVNGSYESRISLRERLMKRSFG
jgi:hypothetical protein